MEADPKQRSQRNRRRRRAAKMQQADRAAAADAAVSGEEDDENRHQKPPRPPTRKKRNKEPLMEEDIIDGFAILSFRSYEELENTIKSSELRRNNPSGALLTAQHANSQAKTEKCTGKSKHCSSPNYHHNNNNNNKSAPHKINLLNNNINSNVNNTTNNNNNNLVKGLQQPQRTPQENGDHHRLLPLPQEESGKPCLLGTPDLSDDDARPLAALQQTTNGPLRPLQQHQQQQPCREHPLSDASSRSSSGRGYMCDSESEDDRGSDAGSDLFTAKAPKRETASPPSNSISEPVPPVAPPPSTVVPVVGATNGPLPCRSPTPASAPASVQPPLAIPSLIQNGPQHPPSSEPPLLGSLPAPNGTAASTTPITPPEAASAALTVVSPNAISPLIAPPAVTPISSSSNSCSGNPPSPPLPINSSPAVVSHLFSPFQVEKPSLGLLSNSHPSNKHNILSSSPPSTLHHGRSSGGPLSFQPHLNHTTNHLYSKKSNGPLTLPPTNSHTPPTGLPPPGLYSPLSPHPYQRTPPLLSSVPLKSTSSSSSSSFPPLQLSVSSVVAPPSSVITHSSTRPLSSGALRVSSPSGVGTATTPTPSLGRDSSSSISSLSQLSQSLPGSSGSAHNNNNKDSNSSSGSSRSRSSSRNNTPCIIGPPPSSLSGVSVPLPNTTTSSTPCCTYSTVSYGSNSGLTSLVFSKPPWVSSSANPILGSVNGPHLTPPLPPRPTPPSPNPSSLPLPPSLHNSHHNSPFGPSAGPSLHPGAPHPGMFAPPMPPPSALAASNLALSSSGPPTHFSDALFSQPNQDFLRRELDTRFLASQDRSIPIPPPPYMRPELHQHQHTHMHQHSPFLPPPLGNSMVPQPNPHLVRQQQQQLLYDKFPKLDSSFYSRNALGLPSYPGLSPLLAPAGPGVNSTPFTPAGHLAAFQPKMNSLVKNKNIKTGRWCAMHVRIAWEIYHHQQKQQQQQSDVHKAAAAAAAASVNSAAGKNPADLLRPSGHLFPSLPRPHDLGPLSSSLLAASAASSHSRTFDPSHHNSFLTPNASHLGKFGVSPYARPGYPGFGAPGSSFGGLGSLAGLTGASLFGNRDLRATCLGPMSSMQDPLYQMHHRTPPTYPPAAPPQQGAPPPPPVSVGSSVGPSASWGGLKVEAERERLQREEQEREKQRKAELEKERREKEMEKSRELERERREQERQKERDRESRVHHHNQEIIRNGDLLTSNRDREREWERSRERKEVARSPHRSQLRDHLPGKNDSAFESSHQQQPHPPAVAPHLLPKQEVKVKEERKEEVELSSRDHNDRTRHDPHPDPSDYLSRTLPPVSLAMSLTSLERSRMMRSLPVIGGGPPDRPPHSQVPPFWPPLPPPVPTSSAGNPVTNSDPFHRAMDFHHHHAAVREQELQRFGLSSVIPPPPHPHRYREAEYARHMVGEMDRHMLEQRERQVAAYERSKLAPPPLRPNEPPGFPGSLGAPGPAALFPHLASGVPHMNSLSSAPGRNKSGSPSTGIPPPLIPCSGNSSVVNNHVGGVSVPGQGASPTLHHKLGLPSSALLENEPFYAKDRREIANLHPSEVDSQSR